VGEGRGRSEKGEEGRAVVLMPSERNFLLISKYPQCVCVIVPKILRLKEKSVADFLIS
jgi:hypothetical protein